MNTACPSGVFPEAFLRAAASTPAPAAYQSGNLVQREKLCEFVGNDPQIQAEVLSLCRDALDAYVPQLREALDHDDVQAIQRLAHSARGSLGMLGLPLLEEIGREVERQHDSLGADCWHGRCEEFWRLLDRLHEELLGQRVA